MRVAALLPVYQGEATVAAVVRGAARHVGHALVVDDGSSDATAQAALSAGAEVLRHERNLGKGAALRSGMRHLRERGFSHAITLDGDGQHLPEEMPKLLEEMRRRPDAIVIGARERGNGQAIASWNRFGNAFADWWIARAARRRFPDTQSGFRLYPLDRVLGLGARAERFAFESEVLILAARRGVPIVARPVAVHYPSPEERSSHYDNWRDTARIIATVVPFLVGLRR